LSFLLFTRLRLIGVGQHSPGGADGHRFGRRRPRQAGGSGVGQGLGAQEPTRYPACEYPLGPDRAEEARGLWHGIRMPGTQIPGVIIAGTFYQHDGAVFYDVHDPEQTIALELDHFKRLVIQVDDPAATVALLETALRSRNA